MSKKIRVLKKDQRSKSGKKKRNVIIMERSIHETVGIWKPCVFSVTTLETLSPNILKNQLAAIQLLFCLLLSQSLTFVTTKISSESKTKVRKILASCSVTSWLNTSSFTSVIIDSRGNRLLFCNWDLISSYIKYQHEFKIGTGQRIIAQRYANFILKMYEMSANVNTLTVTYIS